jgi:NAD(P)-dependent dehydrogenase (short-subunit alcohol dehydrogenase family)
MARLAPGSEGRSSGMHERIALKRWGEIEEIAEAAVFLCSASAAYVTGAILDVDGGSTLGDATRRDLARGLG